MRSDEVVHSDPEILGGTPVFVGTRAPVRTLIDHLEAGDTIEQFLHSFPSVSREQAVAAREMLEAGTLKDTAVSVALVAPPLTILLLVSWAIGWAAYKQKHLGCLDIAGALATLLFWATVTTALIIRRFSPLKRMERTKARQLETLRKIEEAQRSAKPDKDLAQVENDRLLSERMEIEKRKQEAEKKRLPEKCKIIVEELGGKIAEFSYAYSDDLLEVKKEFTSKGNIFSVTLMSHGDQIKTTGLVFECLETTGGGHDYEKTSLKPDESGGFTLVTSTERSDYYTHVKITCYRADEWENHFGALVKLVSERKREAIREWTEQRKEQERKEHEEKKARFGL